MSQSRKKRAAWSPRVLLDDPRYVGGVIIVLLALYPLLASDEAVARRFLYIALLGLVALSMNFTLGVAGQFAIGQAGVFAIGGYTAAILTSHAHWNFWLAILAGMVVAGVLGVVAAAPGLRIGGWSFAMLSLLTAVVIPEVAKLMPGLTGGEIGLAGLAQPSIGSHILTVEELYALAAAVVLIVIVFFWRIRASIYGIAFDGLRNNPLGTEANGISSIALRIGAYFISSLVAGLAGGIFVHVNGFIAPSSFPLSLTIELIAGVVIGGLGTLAGPLLGIGILQYIPELTSSFERYSLLIYGGILIAVMILIPRGLIRSAGDLWRAAVNLVTSRRRGAASQAEAVSGWAESKRTFDESGVPPCEAKATLRVDGVTKAFGGLVALNGVSLAAEPGKITAVLGANGSGKTTLLNLISGYYSVDAGSVFLGDSKLTELRPNQIACRGLSRTFQTPILIPDRTVVDNLICASFQHREASAFASIFHTRSSRRDLARLRDEARGLLSALGMNEFADLEAGVLPPGEQRLVEVAMAIARRPSAVLLDEPAAGLIGTEVEALSEVLRALRTRGYTVLLIEHNVAMVMDLADQVVVLDRGEVIAAGTPDVVREDPAVVEAYLGEMSLAA